MDTCSWCEIITDIISDDDNKRSVITTDGWHITKIKLTHSQLEAIGNPGIGDAIRFTLSKGYNVPVEDQ